MASKMKPKTPAAGGANRFRGLRVRYALEQLPVRERETLPTPGELAERIGDLDDDQCLRRLVLVASQLHADPRWLALGVPSPAAAAAIVHVRRGLTQEGTNCDALCKYLEMLRQPALFPGVCCYCGCTDALGCGDCWWVDDAATICSACLREEA